MYVRIYNDWRNVIEEDRYEPLLVQKVSNAWPLHWVISLGPMIFIIQMVVSYMNGKIDTLL